VGASPTTVMATFEREVVLDVIHRIHAELAPDLACRWNCKAGKCRSCLAEINGLSRLMCMTRIDQLLEGKPIVVAPISTFPVIWDLVTDVSFNYATARSLRLCSPRPPEANRTRFGIARRRRLTAPSHGGSSGIGSSSSTPSAPSTTAIRFGSA
jgi:succinate dehydrogenase/fumarate reductase-like Fe-S protein